MTQRVLLLGDPQPHHVSGALCSAADDLGHVASVCDVRQAIGNRLWHKVCWHFRDRKPSRQRYYERQVLRSIEEFQPTLVIASGGCPIRRNILSLIQGKGIPCVNYLTDDPFSPTHRSRWFLEALPQYDVVFNPRRANIDDLANLGCQRIVYLPFGYNPAIHYPSTSFDSDIPSSDIVFVGGADKDRIPYIRALVDADIEVTVFGGYWNQLRQPNLTIGGIVSPETLRDATAKAKVTLILVRRTNRDGHVMRTFEATASSTSTCMLVEDTQEHRDLFGEESDCVTYFGCPKTLVSAARLVLDASDEERRNLASACYRRIVTDGQNSYADRLSTIIRITAETRS